MPKFDNALKSISKTDSEIRVGNYIVLFNSRDLEFMNKGKNLDGSLGEYFASTVEVESPFTRQGRLEVDFEHGDDPDVIDGFPSVKNGNLGYVDWNTARRDEKGIFVERVLNRRKRYIQLVDELIEAGLIGNSSEAMPEQVKKLADGAIVAWPLMRDTLTVMPAEPKMLQGNTLRALKALSKEFSAVKKLLEESSSTNPSDQSGGGRGGTNRGDRASSRTSTGSNKREVKSMDILTAIKKLVPGLTAEQYEQLAAVLGMAGMAISPTDAPVTDEAGEELKSIPLSKLTTELKALDYDVVLPGQKPAAKKAVVRPPFQFAPAKEDDDDDDEAKRAAKAVGAAHMLRFATENEAQKAILSDVIGQNYPQIIHEQNVAFGRYLRGGERALTSAEYKSLKAMYFPIDQVTRLVREGFDTRTIKATQVEAIGELGGIAVPPNVQSEIDRRLPGLTAVRGGGARVVQLINSNSIEIPQYVGDSDRWIGLMRGQWGTETQTPVEKNFKLQMVPVFAHIYTYKVPFSRSLVEDAANLVSLVEEDIAITAAIDEDEADLVGDGAGKPEGILPGGANAHALKSVKSGAAAALTAAGIKALKRGVASQYRKSARFVGNSDTYGAIEQLVTVATGEFVFPDMSETEKLLNRAISESGAIPDVAANAFPLLFADMSGYTIVERLGMSIERFMDSGTGPNKIEFHVRRRIGGKLEKPWMFAVQKVEA